MRIGVDLMGGDTPPLTLFEAVIQAADRFLHLTFIVFATPSTIATIRDRTDRLSERIIFHPVNEVIDMGDDPLLAVRRKKDSSLVVGMRLLKNGQLAAFVSSGNTGALVASAALFLPPIPTIERPALLALLPTATGSVAVIDVGGTLSPKVSHLIQFAHMGIAYQRCVNQIAVPTVGLLNIGVEARKGTSQIREAYAILQRDAGEKIHFVGNVEGRDVFRGGIDVLVTDGFTGNVFLKTSEGVSSFILECLKGVSVEGSLVSNLKRQFSYEEYPGAVICGVDGIVMKCHGLSSAKGMFNGIVGAVSLVEKQFVAHLKAEITP